MRYSRTLKTSTDCLRLLQTVVGKLEQGEIDNSTAKTLIYAASTAGGIIKSLELERKIEDLEKLAEKVSA